MENDKQGAAFNFNARGAAGKFVAGAYRVGAGHSIIIQGIFEAGKSNAPGGSINGENRNVARRFGQKFQIAVAQHGENLVFPYKIAPSALLRNMLKQLYVG